MLIPSFAAAPFIDSAFIFVFAMVVGREIVAGRNLKNLPVLILLTILASANVLSHLRTFEPELALLGERIGIAVVAMLISLIGGRIVPSFTRNWMAKQKLKPEPTPTGWFDALVLAASALALALWAAAPQFFATGLALALAGVLHWVRLARWRGWRTRAEPLVLILHLGYAWLAFGLTLMGLAIISVGVVPAASGLHALTAGAFGVMTLAVMTRASLGHVGQPLTATPRISAIYVLVNLGALVRVISPLAPDIYTPLLIVSALLWGGAFVLFVIVYAPLLLRARVDASLRGAKA